MRSLRKLGSGLTALALCFLLTGFFGGGEKPQDCINAIIKAIDNNDSKSFGERVPLEFFISAVALTDERLQKDMDTGISTMNSVKEIDDLTSVLLYHVKLMTETEGVAQEQKNTLSQIAVGKTALKKDSMWTTEVLRSIVVSEEGAGEEKDTATATVTANGKTLTLGLAKLNDKWVLLSMGGNKKSALDTALFLKLQADRLAAELPQRRKGNELYLKELAPLFDRMAKLAEAGDAKAYEDLLQPKYRDTSKSTLPSSVTLDSPELWKAVTDSLASTMQTTASEAKLDSKITHEPFRMSKRCAEVVFKSDTVLIVKDFYLSRFGDEKTYTEWYEQWLAGNSQEFARRVYYELYLKQDGLWRLTTTGMVRMRDGGASFPFITLEGGGTPKSFSFSVLNYLEAFGKRYSSLMKAAKEHEEQLSTKASTEVEVLATLLREKKGEDFVQRIDFPTLLYQSFRKGYMERSHEQIIATLVPEALQLRRRAMVDSINATGSCEIMGIRVDEKALKTAKISKINDATKLELADGVLLFVTGKDVPLLLVSTGKDTPLEELSDLYASVNAYFEKKIKDGETQLAYMACYKSVLDSVQFQNTRYEVKFTDGRIKKIFLDVQTDAQNTNKREISVEGITLTWTDVNGSVVLQESCRFTGPTRQISRPGRTVRMNFNNIGLSSESIYCMQQVREGKFRLNIYPALIKIDDEHFPQTPYGKKEWGEPRQLDDGRYQLEDYPPVPLSYRYALSLPKEEKKFYEQALKQHEASETEKSKEYLRKLFEQVKASVSDDKKSVSLSHFASPITGATILVEALENGVVVNSYSLTTRSQTERMQFEAPTGATVEAQVTSLELDREWRKLGDACLISGLSPSSLYEERVLPFTLTAEQAAGKVVPKAEAPAETPAEAPAEAPKVETPAEAPKTEAPKAETPKAEALKAETPATATATASGATTATDTPTPPEGKNSGKAVLGSTTLDLVGSAFGPDGKPDSAIRVSVHNPSPLVAVRIDNIGGTMASWKTSGVKTSAKGVIAVVKDGKPLNAANAAFSLDVAKPVVLDLLVQDTGVIAEGKTRLRAVFHHADGKRSYAILEAANK